MSLCDTQRGARLELPAIGWEIPENLVAQAWECEVWGKVESELGGKAIESDLQVRFSPGEMKPVVWRTFQLQENSRPNWRLGTLSWCQYLTRGGGKEVVPQWRLEGKKVPRKCFP